MLGPQSVESQQCDLREGLGGRPHWPRYTNTFKNFAGERRDGGRRRERIGVAVFQRGVRAPASSAGALPKNCPNRVASSASGSSPDFASRSTLRAVAMIESATQRVKV